MKNITPFVVAALLCLAGWTTSVSASFAEASRTVSGPAPRPNLLFILADDLGAGDLPLYGRTDIKTPALDRLASEGVLFHQAYAAGTECSPTRTALLTGRYLQRAGGLECAIGSGNVGRYDDAIHLAAIDQLGLPANEISLAQCLSAAGYATSLFGKWHLGMGPQFSPQVHGFQEALYIIEGGADYFHYFLPPFGHQLYYNGRPAQREGYFTDMITSEALANLERNAHRPFFLYLPYTTPHSPFQGPDDYRDEPLAHKDPLWDQSKAPPEVYRKMLENLDGNIGRVLDKLDELGLRENTLVIFTSDNGGTRSARNAPFRGYKSETFEGGLRVPAIMRWPGQLKAGTVSEQVTVTMDFTRSMLRLAGATLPAGRNLDGIDIVQHLQDGDPEFPRQLFFRARRGEHTWWGVRDGNLKYVRHQSKTTPEEYLFDLSQDIGETRDLLPDKPCQADHLREALRRWEFEVRAPRLHGESKN